MDRKMVEQMVGKTDKRLVGQMVVLTVVHWVDLKVASLGHP